MKMLMIMYDLFSITKQVTHIASNLSALLAADQRDVFMVQLVARSFGIVPVLFVIFLKSNHGNTVKNRTDNICD